MANEWQGLDDAVEYADGLLVGETVRLRATRDDDYEQLAQWWNDPALKVLQTTWVRPTPTSGTVELMRAWSANTGNNVGLAVERLDDGALVGHATLHSVDKNRCAELAVVLGRDYWSGGHGTDAVRVLVRYGFAEMGLHRIQLGTFAFNTRAIAAYRRVGFAEEGRRRQAVFHAGQWHDDVLMAVLADEWHASQT